MKIIILVENTTNRPGIEAEHGLSIYMETGGARILLDAGQKELFAHNAAALGVDLSQVDYAVLSHGHGDHSGGLPLFRSINPTAPVYMARQATRRSYVRRFGILHFNVGMPRAFASDAGIVGLDADRELSHGAWAVVGIQRQSPYLRSSSNLYMRKGLWFAQDDFAHELAFVVHEGDSAFVFSSCSHLGLHDIMGALAERGYLRPRTYVFAGMHLYVALKGTPESPAVLERFAADLLAFPGVTYYAGHCTGEVAFSYLKSQMGERLQPMSSGDVFMF
ncbi:MAG TPA: MBL fold metallo-hydrolase [Rectinemataceae bacterium]